MRQIRIVDCAVVLDDDETTTTTTPASHHYSEDAFAQWWTRFCVDCELDQEEPEMLQFIQPLAHAAFIAGSHLAS
jgi:hypothetical protein